MFQFTYRLKIAERVKAKCERHPAITRSGMEGAASRAGAPPALHCSSRSGAARA